MQGGNIWEAIKNVVDVIEKEWRELCNEGAVLYRLMIDEPCKQGMGSGCEYNQIPV